MVANARTTTASKGVYQVRAANGHAEPATIIPPERIVRRLGFTCAADHSGHADKRPGRHY
jgi:hypothetical protein